MSICHITQEKALKVAARGTSCELFYYTYMFIQSSGSTHCVTQTYAVVTHTCARFRLLWNCEVSCNRVVLIWDSCWPQVKHMVYCYALILVGILNDWAYDRSWRHNWFLRYNTFFKKSNNSNPGLAQVAKLCFSWCDHVTLQGIWSVIWPN